jgi:hypothetical protein
LAVKKIPLYVKNYVIKFFSSEFDGNVLHLKNRVVTLSQDFHQAPKTLAKDLSQSPDHTLIFVECKFSSLHVLFAIKNSMERRFRERMYNEVQLLIKLGYSRWNALQTFYKVHSITEEDYDFNSAYRLMQKMEKVDPSSVKPIKNACEKLSTL